MSDINLLQKVPYDSSYIFHGNKTYLINKFINRLMLDGKKSIARTISKKTLWELKKITRKNPYEVLLIAVENVKPSVQVKSLRLAGSTYQVPVEIHPEKQLSYALRWLIESARNRKEKRMEIRLSKEIFDAYMNKGASVERKLNLHKMAESNRAFVHYRW